VTCQLLRICGSSSNWETKIDKERATAMYTLIGSAKLNELDPELHLSTVLAQIAEHPISRIHDPLPWNMAAALQTRSSQAA
jgi:transposase